jgi:hypothetical protein
MMNHGGINANIRIEWHQWDKSGTSRLSSPVLDLMSLPFSPLDVQYVATRDIAEGEELLLSYGQEWEEAWVQHLEKILHANTEVRAAREAWESRNKEGPKPIPEKPQFRTFITAPPGLFPEHFNMDCVGFGCGKDALPDESGDLEGLGEKDVLVAKAMAFAKNNFLIGKEIEKSTGQGEACAEIP